MAAVLQQTPEQVTALLQEQIRQARIRAAQARHAAGRSATGKSDGSGQSDSDSSGLEELSWQATDGVLSHADVQSSVVESATVGYLFTPRAVLGNRDLELHGLAGLVRGLQQRGIPVAMLGGTAEEREVIREVLGVPIVEVNDPSDYEAAVTEARRLLGVDAVRIIREQGDPAPIGIAVTTINLTDLARQWPLLFDDLQITVQDLDALQRANDEAARLLWQA